MRFRKKQWICAGAALLSLLVFGILTIISQYLSGLHRAQYAAERWRAQSELRYVQMSAFYSPDDGFTENSLQRLRESVDSAVRSVSLTAANEGARVWCDAYSASAGTVQIMGTRRYSVQAQVMAVGGDFFTIHAPVLKSGSYLQKSDLMQDRIVIDEELAWQLFGSSDVAGMEVEIDRKFYRVAGVAARNHDYASEKAYGEIPRMYISFDLYEEWMSQRGGMAAITCYEILLPDPVRSFAKNTFEQAAAMGGNAKIVQNSNRFALSGRYGRLADLHGMLIVSDGIAYPYWENAARILDFDLSLLLVGQCVFLIFPLFMALYLLWKGYRRADAFLTSKRLAHKNRFRLLVKTE